MSKISPNMIRNICSVKSVTDMFLDFENYKGYFDEGTKEEYLAEVKSFIINSLNKHNEESSFIMEKDMVSSIIKIYSTYFCSKDNTDEEMLGEKIFNLLREYENLVNIAIIRRDGPCSFSNNDLRNKALEVAGIQLEEIDSFFKKTKYEEKFLNALHEFDDYLISLKPMSASKFNDFSSLLENAGVNIPQEYVDLYFSQVLTHKKAANYLCIKNLVSSMALNLAEEKGITCKFEIKEMDLSSAGLYDNGIITLSDNELRSFAKNPVEEAPYFFETLFHEFWHLNQDMNYRIDRRFSYHDIKMLKDELLFTTLNSKFGRDNYCNFSYELDAREMSRIYTARYLGRIGAKFPRNVEGITKLDKKKHETDNRVVEYKLVPLDHLFDEFISNIISIYKSDYSVDIFDEYPILNLMYDRNGCRHTTCTLFKMREEAKKELTTASKKERTALENKIYNINQILYNQNLSFVNLVADFKEMVNDMDLVMDTEEKVTYMQEYLYSRISESNKRSFIDMSIYVGTLLKKKISEVIEDARITLKTGQEMIKIFHEWFAEKQNFDEESGPKLTNKTNKKH